MNLEDILKLINTGGIIGVLIFILTSGFKKAWVFGWAYSELLEREKQIRVERDKWQEMALRGTDLAERAITIKTGG